MAEQESMSFLRRRLLEIQQKTRDEYDALEKSESKKSVDVDSSETTCPSNENSSATDCPPNSENSASDDRVSCSSHERSPQSNDALPHKSNLNPVAPVFVKSDYSEPLSNGISKESLAPALQRYNEPPTHNRSPQSSDAFPRNSSSDSSFTPAFVIRYPDELSSNTVSQESVAPALQRCNEPVTYNRNPQSNDAWPRNPAAPVVAKFNPNESLPKPKSSVFRPYNEPMMYGSTPQSNNSWSHNSSADLVAPPFAKYDPNEPPSNIVLKESITPAFQRYNEPMTYGSSPQSNDLWSRNTSPDLVAPVFAKYNPNEPPPNIVLKETIVPAVQQYNELMTCGRNPQFNDACPRNTSPNPVAPVSMMYVSNESLSNTVSKESMALAVQQYNELTTYGRNSQSNDAYPRNNSPNPVAPVSVMYVSNESLSNNVSEESMALAVQQYNELTTYGRNSRSNDACSRNTNANSVAPVSMMYVPNESFSNTVSQESIVPAVQQYNELTKCSRNPQFNDTRPRTTNRNPVAPVSMMYVPDESLPNTVSKEPMVSAIQQYNQQMTYGRNPRSNGAAPRNTNPNPVAPASMMYVSNESLSNTVPNESVAPALRQYNELMTSNRNPVRYDSRAPVSVENATYSEPNNSSDGSVDNGFPAYNLFPEQTSDSDVDAFYDAFENITKVNRATSIQPLITLLQTPEKKLKPILIPMTDVVPTNGDFIFVPISTATQGRPVVSQPSQVTWSKVVANQIGSVQSEDTQKSTLETPSVPANVPRQKSNKLEPRTRNGYDEPSVPKQKSLPVEGRSPTLLQQKSSKFEPRIRNGYDEPNVSRQKSHPVERRTPTPPQQTSSKFEPRNRHAYDEPDRTEQRYNSRVSRTPETTPQDSRRENGCYRRPKKVEYSELEEARLADSLRKTYDCENMETLLRSCFSKEEKFVTPVTLSNRHFRGKPENLFTCEKWNDEKLLELQNLKRKLNSVKEKLSEFELNDWHRHTRSTNPADLVMRRLRSDIKVEFLTQAWCKFYEIVNRYHLIPKAARHEGELYSIHLCEAPGAFVASLNHYLKIQYPNMVWRWKANSLNPYYEGNHLSEMINDDRFMLQTINYWDFGPDMTGDITHPEYPNHLRKRCGEHLPHLVTADGSFDCQDKPEEQESSVSWLHLKETLTALRVLRKGGYFVIKMFTFFECDTVCLLFLLKCVFEAIDVFKPATSKEGNSEVYVICREYKDSSSFQPYLKKLMSITYEQHQKCSMFSFETISRVFLKNLISCAQTFSTIQMKVIERNIRLYPYTHNEELQRQCEYLQEKVFEKYVETYEVESILLSETVVRVPYRKFEKRYSIPKVIEERDRKQGSHNDQKKRSTLVIKDLAKKIVDEIHEPLSSRIMKITVMPKIRLNTTEFAIKSGKPIEGVFSSQFCHGTYMRIRNELISALGQMKYNIAMSDVKGRLMHEDDPNVCDFTDICMRHTNYHKAQTLCYQQLYERLTLLQDGDSLKLFSFPTLTQFHISVLYILGQMFSEVSFQPPNMFNLRCMIADSYKTWMEKLEKISQFLQNPDNAVISILPIDRITGGNNQFYSWIIDANNARVLNEIDLAVSCFLL